MTQDQLDRAIDRVTAQLTRVDDNDALAAQIIDALPERATWSLRWWMPRLAITATLALATVYVVLQPFDDRSTTVLRTENAGQPTVAASPIVERPSNARRTTVERSPNVRRTPVERPSNARRTIDVSDHERSLEAIDALSALTLASIAPRDLPAEGTLVVEPLAVEDLPLTPDLMSPQE